MRVIKWILAAVAALFAVFFIGGALLPQQVALARSVSIAAPPEAVFPHVNSLRAGQAWSPWLARDPDVALVFDGPDAGVGARMSWTSDDPQVGSGRQEIIRSEENRHVASALDFGEMGTATATFDLDGTGGGTTVTWGLVADMGTRPAGRWMGLMMDRWVGAEYEAGLANLKALVEG